MSHLIANVLEIKNSDSLHIVKFKANNQTITMMSLDLDAKIKIGTEVKLIFKPMNIAIAKNFSGDISCSNRLPCRVTSVENGVLLGSIELLYFGTTLESIITLDSSKRMNLKVEQEVSAFIKSSDISIGEIINA